MAHLLLQQIFSRMRGIPPRLTRRRRRPRQVRRPSWHPLASLHVQALEPRLALAADTGSAKPFWGNGHYYAVTQADTDWHTANRESRTTTLSQLGITGGLAAVTSVEENDFIANYATGRSDASQPNYGGTPLRWEAFLAGADTTDTGTVEGRWLWFTGDGNPDNNVILRENGTNYGYSNWWSRQPDNKGNEDFLAIHPGGGWNDVVIARSDYVTEWGRAGVEFNAGFAAPLSSGTRNGTENGQPATMTISFDRHVPWDYVDIRNSTPLIDIPVTLGGTAVAGVDYDLSVSGGDSFYRDGRIYVRNTQSVVLSFTPRNNHTWQAPRSITATLGADGAENIYGIRDSSQTIFGGSGNSTSEVWLFDDEPLLSLGQGAYQFVRVPWTGGILPANNADFNTNADTLIFDTDGIAETEASSRARGFVDSYAMRWETYVRIPETGSYRFRVWSDDYTALTVRRNHGGGDVLASLSHSVGGNEGITTSLSLQKGDVVWLRHDYYEYNGPNYASLNWDRPDGVGGTITNQPIPGSVMFLSESLARGVDRTESPSHDTSALGFQLFANQPTSGLLNVRLTSTSETANSTVETGLAQRRTDSTRVGDDYALVSGGSQLTTGQIGVNGAYGTLGWQPNRPATSLQNVQSFDVQVLTDSYAESTESITLTLGSNSGYGVSNSSQTLTIADSPFVLSVTAGRNPREAAGNDDDLGWFTVSTNGRASGDREGGWNPPDAAAPAGGLRVRYAITGGTAIRNADYTAPQATLSTASFRAEDLLVMPTGATEARIYIAALADAIREGDETVTLELLTNMETDDQNFRFQRYNVDPAARQATLTIHDSAVYTAAVVTTPADRTGLGTVRAQLTGGQQVASFDVHVTSQPRADVVVSLATTSGSLSTQQVTFTSSNWTQPQRVALTGLRTDLVTTVSVTTASSDPQYGSLATQQRIVPSNWASELELSLWEGGVPLAAQPAASVAAVDGTEGTTSRFGFELGLGSPVVGSPVELLYTLEARDGFVLEGDRADVRHEPDATYRPLVLTNSGAGPGNPAFVDLGGLTTVSDAGEFSAQGWVRRDVAVGGDTVLEFSNASGQDAIWLGFPDSTSRPRLTLRSASGAILAELTGDASLAPGEWNHLAFSIDRNKVASLYVNGELVDRQTLSSGPSRIARSANLLGRANDGFTRLDGAVRAVAIWNAARTQDEIRASMNTETPGGAGLLSGLPLNGSLANTVAGAPAATLSSGSVNKAVFAATPIYARNLPVGASRVDVPLEVLDDLTAEGIKSLTLSLVGSGRYGIGGASRTGTAELTDDDTADVEFLAAWSNLDASSSGWTSTSQFRISEADQATNTQTRLGIRLTSRPTADVRLSLRTSSDVRVSRPGQAGGSALDLVFTPATWDQVQELLLQGVDDSSVDGDIARQLSFQVTSSDQTYARLAPSLSVLVLDDDTLAIDDDRAAGQSSSAPFAAVSAPSQSRIAESGTDSAEFTITLSAPAERDTLVFFDLEQSNRQLFASDISITPSQNAQALTGLARFEGNTSNLKVNFQSRDATTPSGYVSDSGEVFGARRNGWTYGWSKSHTDLGRDRNRNSKQKLDTLVHVQAGATWEVALPNGMYEVSASVGDARYPSTHTLNVEGVSYFAARPLAANKFALHTTFITVSDGRLTLDTGAAPDLSTRINYLEIKAINDAAVGVDLDGIDETSVTFAANGQTGNFSTTWSGYIAIPDTGFYSFSVPTQGGVRFTLDGKVVIDQMIDTRATWSTDLLQLNRGDFVPFSLDYQSFNNTNPAVALHWQRPTGNNTDSVSAPVPAEALSRVDGFHLLIAQGSSSATVTVRGIDDAIAEGDEALAVRLLSSRGVELVVTGQRDGTQGVSELAVALGITDREHVTLAAGTVLDLGRGTAAASQQRSTLARFRLSEAATVHRDRPARLRGTLTWVDEATRTSLAGSVVDLVAGTDGETYQVLDRSVTLAVAGPLAADTAAGQGRYLASLTLQPTNRGSVELAAGTRLVYVTATKEETVTLVLVNSLTLRSGETVTAVPVLTEERSRDLDLTSAVSPLVGLGSQVALPDTASLTITDDDLAGLLFTLDRDGYRPVDGSREPLVEQGDSLIRYVRLTSQPDDAVTVYLETNDASEARLQIAGSNPAPASARIPFTFTPEDWQTGQAFRIVPHDDRLVDGDQNVGIFSRTTSSDVFYAIPSAGRLDFVVRDNDTSGMLVELQQSSITRAGNGFINLSLTAEPTAPVVVTLIPSDHQFTINDRSVGRGETVVFTPENWSTVRTVGLTAVDDDVVEDLSTSTLRFSTASSDARFNALPVDPIRIVITDNDLPTATLELVSDGKEEGRPGRFRIRLSEAASASAGSKGLVVNYRVTAVGLDSALPYGSDVAGRLDKIVQTPDGVNGTVRIAPGQSVSDVLVVPIDDFLADGFNKSVSVQLAGGDGYTVAADSTATSATVQIVNNDVAGMLVMTSGERLLVKESGATATYQLALLSEPRGDVRVTISEKVAAGASRQLGTSTTPYATTVTFTRSNWFTPQQISVRAYDDLTIEDGSGGTAFTGIHSAELSYHFSSSADSDYNTASHTSGHFTNTVQRVDVLDFELSDTTATAMQAALTSLQEGIDSLALPIVGSLDGKTGAGLRKFITNLSNSIHVVGTPTPAKLSGLISREIASAIGVPEQAVRVEVSMKDVTSGNPAVVVRFSFADGYNVSSVPLAADFGLPGLGFQTEGSFDADFSYEAGLELVFPRSGDIYLNTGSAQTFVRAHFNAGLTDEFRLTGGMGLMQLDARNQPSVNPNVTIAGRPADTELDVGFVVTVGGGAGGDAKLTFTELTSSSLDLEQVFQYGFSGNAAMSLGVTTSVAGLAAIPTFTFDLSALLPLFDYSNQAAAAAAGNATSIYFDNIRLDLGSFITDLLDPIVGGLDDVLKPLYPLVDALYSDTQVFATVGLGRTFDVDGDGKTSTIDLSRWFANFYAKIDEEQGQELKARVDATVEFLDLLKGVMDLVRDLERLDAGENFFIDYGSYELAAFTAGSRESDPADVELDESSTPNLTRNTKQQADAGGTNQQTGRPSSSFQKTMSQANELGFSFPLLEDPINVVKLLLGQDATLFEWRMPAMGMTSEIEEYFPIFAGVEGIIAGGFEVEAHLGFGFDTYGLRQWRRDEFAPGDFWKVFNGFYVADLDEHGRDIPEFTMDATMGAGLGYNARVVRADIIGGLAAAARMDLLDEGEIAGTSDGKIRGQEITGRITNPLSLFELSGDLTAYLQSKVQIGIDAGFYSIWQTVWQRKLAEIPVFRFGVGGRYGSGTVSNGHLAGATVFFDGNMNGRIDSLEPVTISDAEGRYALDIDLRTFDTNHNGRIDDTEGRLVAFGGVDTSMDQLLAMPFVAPLGSMITPLTTLYYFAEGPTVPAAEVDAFIRTEFDLGDFDYLTQDPLAVLAESASFDDARARDALAAYLAHIKLHLTWDLVAGGLELLLPDDIPADPASRLNLLKAFTGALLEQPRDLPIGEAFARAVAESWRRANPDSDPRVADFAAQAAEMAALAGAEMAARLDQMRDAALADGASPTAFLEAINGLKQEAFILYRQALDGISEGLHRISDPAELVQTVAARLNGAHGNLLNDPPTAVAIVPVVPSLPESAGTTSRIKVADIVVTDDALGWETILLTGADAASFEVDGLSLYLKAGVALDFEAKAFHEFTVSVADPALAGSTPVTTSFTLAVTDVDEVLKVERITPPAEGVYRAGQALRFTVELSEVVQVRGRPQIQVWAGAVARVASYVGGTGTTRLTFQYVVTATDNASVVRVGTRLVFPVGTFVAAGRERLAAALPTGAAGRTAPGVRLDSRGPVAGVTTGPARGIYRVGQTLDFVVRFSEPVFVTGTPRIGLSGFALPRQATYVSGSSSAALTFRYVVQQGDALGPKRTLALGKALVLPAGATIADEAGNRAVLAISPLALKGVLVSGTVSPTRSSVRAAAFASFG